MAIGGMLIGLISSIERALGIEKSYLINTEFLWLWWLVAIGWLNAIICLALLYEIKRK